jgi:hypothetical protein
VAGRYPYDCEIPTVFVPLIDVAAIVSQNT